jgi:hypothetical protein
MRRLILTCAAALVSACAADNPKFCCVDAADCAQFDVDETRFCSEGEVCDEHTCVAAVCDASTDCIDPSLPYCVNQLCEARCDDQACADVAGAPICALDGVCVGCVDDAGCTPESPVCDDVTRACRPCSNDGECASGVCLFADGTCASEEQLIFVASNGSDIGSCDRENPCRQLTYALGHVTSERDVVRISSGSLTIVPTTIGGTARVYISAIGTELAGTVPNLTIADDANVTIDNLQFVTPPDDDYAIKSTTSGTLRLSRLSFDETPYPIEHESKDGRVVVSHCEFRGSGVFEGDIRCQRGTIEVTESSFDGNGGIRGTCNATVRRNRFNRLSVNATGGRLTFENNLVTTDRTYTDSFRAQDLAAGSSIRFNTFACTLEDCEEGYAFSCSDTTALVSNNVIAWNSPTPVFGTCIISYNVFDDTAGAIGGNGNVSADIDSIFVSRVGLDFHLAEGSAARGAANPTDDDVSSDFEGNARPNPAGTVSDVGAFEAP